MSSREMVAEFMHAFGTIIRRSPTADITNAERVLRARLVLEEAFEFVESMGCGVVWQLTMPGLSAIQVVDSGGVVDLVAAADALADVIYVAEGSALTMGIPMSDVMREVHRSNMAKAGGGVDKYGKIQKPAGWVPPDIAGVLRRDGWVG